MLAARINYAWIAICLASIFICLKTDAIPFSSLLSTQTANTFHALDNPNEDVSVPKRIVTRSADSDDNMVENGDDDNKDKVTTTQKPDSFHHGDHGHGHGHTVLKPNHNNHDHSSDDDNDRNNSGSGFNILEFFGTIFRLVWGFVSNIPALFGSSSAGFSGGQ